jgi:hypothetical protein
MDYHWDYIYEPDAQEALGALLVRYIEALVYQGLVENTRRMDNKTLLSLLLNHVRWQKIWAQRQCGFLWF